MISLHLIEAQTGLPLGMQQVSKIPAPGATLALLNDGRLIGLEVLRTFTTLNEGRLFASTAHWAECRLRSKRR